MLNYHIKFCGDSSFRDKSQRRRRGTVRDTRRKDRSWVSGAGGYLTLSRSMDLGCLISGRRREVPADGNDAWNHCQLNRQLIDIVVAAAIRLYYRCNFDTAWGARPPDSQLEYRDAVVGEGR